MREYVGKEWHVAMWDAINDYAKSCGGDPEKYIYGNTKRMAAVTAIEVAVERLVDGDDGLFPDGTCPQCTYGGEACPAHHGAKAQAAVKCWHCDKPATREWSYVGGEWKSWCGALVCGPVGNNPYGVAVRPLRPEPAPMPRAG